MCELQMSRYMNFSVSYILSLAHCRIGNSNAAQARCPLAILFPFHNTAADGRGPQEDQAKGQDSQGSRMEKEQRVKSSHGENWKSNVTASSNRGTASNTVTQP